MGQPPSIKRPSGFSSTGTPKRRRFFVMTASRSLSLCRSSLASLISVVPSAKAAATARIGISSIRLGISFPETCVALRRPPPVTVMVPSGSGVGCSTFSMIPAPMRRRAEMRAVRVGFSPTLRRVSFAPGKPAARTIQNAAEEKSPGTSNSVASRR